MPNLDIVGTIVQKKAENMSEDAIRSYLDARGFDTTSIDTAFLALDEDIILEVKSMSALTPVSPIIYRFGIKKIEKETRVFHGLMKDTIQVAVRTIDQVNIAKNFVSATVTIVHSGESQIQIKDISRQDAEKVRKIYCDIIEAQRKSIINVAQD